MLKLGQYQKLTIVKKVEFGVYLAEEQDMDCMTGRWGQHI